MNTPELHSARLFGDHTSREIRAGDGLVGASGTVYSPRLIGGDVRTLHGEQVVLTLRSSRNRSGRPRQADDLAADSKVSARRCADAARRRTCEKPWLVRPRLL